MQQEKVLGIPTPEPGFGGEDQRDSDNEQEEREDEIGGGPAIPLGVFEGPVGMIVAWVIDQDHGGDGDTAEKIERGEA